MSNDLSTRLLRGDFKVSVFDLDGTLYSSQAKIEHQLRPAVRSVAKEFLINQGVDESDVADTINGYLRSRYYSIGHALQANFGSSFDMNRFFTDVYEKLDISKMTPYEGLAEQIKKLSGFSDTYVLTNSYSAFAHKALKKLNLSDAFKGVCSVDTNPDWLRKPEVKVFEELFNKLNVKPSQVIFFDDIASSLEVIRNHFSEATTVLVGNGLVDSPGFIDLHTGSVYDGKPNFVNHATHDLAGFLRCSLNT